MWMTVIMMTAGVILVQSYLIREDTHRSCTIRTTESYMLDGHTFDRQRSTGILECAHACLSENRCWSFNFHQSGECYLNSHNASGVKEWYFLFHQGYTYGELQNLSEPVFTPPVTPSPAIQFIFTSLGAVGRHGPTSTSGYMGTNLQDSVRLESGKQIWTVPKTATYIIDAYGASGSDGRCHNHSSACYKGGLGAKITGTFQLTMGTSLTILVGQKGSLDVSFEFAGGGGGGTFVINNNASTKIAIAGGGGGGGKPVIGYQDGDPGQAGNNGSRCGGASGMGGRLCSFDSFVNFLCGSGAGFNGDGKVKNWHTSQSFINGGVGGKSMIGQCVGGFGGGGFAMAHAGGGGGYSGGGLIGNETTGIAGGGGSYNSGTQQDNKPGVNKGDGRVIIKML